MKTWTAENGIGATDDLTKNMKLKETIYKDLMRIADENKFNSLEKPKQIHLIKDMWTTDDLLTPTMKTKRNIAKV